MKIKSIILLIFLLVLCAVSTPEFEEIRVLHYLDSYKEAGWKIHNRVEVWYDLYNKDDELLIESYDLEMFLILRRKK